MPQPHILRSSYTPPGMRRCSICGNLKKKDESCSCEIDGKKVRSHSVGNIDVMTGDMSHEPEVDYGLSAISCDLDDDMLSTHGLRALRGENGCVSKVVGIEGNPPRICRVEEAAALSKMEKSELYSLAKDGHVLSTKYMGRVYVIEESVKEYSRMVKAKEAANKWANAYIVGNVGAV